MSIPLNVLIVEDRESDAMLVLRELWRAGYELHYERVETLGELRSALDRQPWQIVLSDYSLPHFSGLDALRMVRSWDSELPFIIVSGVIGEDTAVATMKAGADDYVLKDNLARLAPAVQRGLRDAEMRRARRDAEEGMRLQEALFRSLIENVADVIVILDERGVVHYQSPSVERILGYRPSESIGTRSLACLHPDEQALGTEILFSRISRQRQIPNLECRVRHKDGSWRVLEGTVTNLLDDPAAHGIVCNFRDMTERKFLEKQLVRVQRMETIGNVAGGIAHDLNNLLTPVLIASDLLAADLAPADRDALVATLKSGANRAVDVVNQLLSLAQGVRTGHRVSDVAEVVRETERLLRFGFPPEIQIYTAIPSSLSSVSIDATQLGQVLMNLCVNARDAMPEGGRLMIEARDVRIEEEVADDISDPTPGEYVELRVADTGGGIAKEIQQRVFEPFFTTKEPGSGTGLGLWMVTRILKDFGGYFELDSGPGGTRCTAYLPVVKESPKPQAAPRIPLEDEIKVNGWVLIAEGEATIRQIIKETLETYGCQTITAADGASALAAYQENLGKMGLAIIDMHLPVMDGPATIASIRELDPQSRIVLQYRASTAPHDLQTVRPLVSGALEKPYTTQELLSSIREAVRRGEGRLTGRVLIVSDDAYVVNIIRAALRTMDIQLVAASTEAVAMRALHNHCPNLVLLGIDTFGVRGRILFTQIRKAHADLPVIVMSDQLEQEAAYPEADVFIQTPITTARIKRAVLQTLARSPPRSRHED